MGKFRTPIIAILGIIEVSVYFNTGRWEKDAVSIRTGTDAPGNACGVIIVYPFPTTLVVQFYSLQVRRHTPLFTFKCCCCIIFCTANTHSIIVKKDIVAVKICINVIVLFFSSFSPSQI